MKILFLQKRLLFPTDSGGKIRTLNVLRHLARWHDITYLSNVQASDEAQDLDSMTKLGLRLETIPWKEARRKSARFYLDLAINVLSPYPFTVAKDFDPALRDRAEQLLAAEDFDLVICDFVQMARNAIDLKVTTKILFEHNVEAQIFLRHAESDSGWARRQYMRLQWHKMKRFEAAAGKRFDAVVAVSGQDRETFEQQYGWRHVKTIDTAVDLEYFHPNGQPVEPDRLVFVASFDWLPNEDGVRHFVERIWPLVRSRRPRATFQIVGRNPTAVVRRLAEVDGVEVVGTVPDVRPYQNEAAIVVVPLLVGGGTRIKIFEAMAMGKAVVSTPLGAEGLPVTSGKHLMLADEPEQFANVVCELLEDRQRRESLGAAAREFVCAKYSAELVARQFENICLEAVSSTSG